MKTIIEKPSPGLSGRIYRAFGVDQCGFEMARHDFRLTEAGARLAQKKAAQMPNVAAKIEHAAGTISAAGNLDYMELSIAAKAYYVLTKLNGNATREAITEMLPKFGWTVSQEQLDKATDFLSRSSLIGATLAKAGANW